MASTINGYEGTGRSLSLKLIQQLRQQSSSNNNNEDANHLKSVSRDGKDLKESSSLTSSGRTLKEIKLEEPIRYGFNDPVESWLNKLLCLDCCSPDGKNFKMMAAGCPHPSKCELYYVNRDTLFSYHPVSEAFLQKMMSLYVASHYKNSPNDLQLLRYLIFLYVDAFIYIVMLLLIICLFFYLLFLKRIRLHFLNLFVLFK